MKLASYIGTRAGIYGLGNILIRLRLRGPYSHSEIVFEPDDGPEVAALMPDGSLEPDVNGALWCCSSVGLERIPAHSPRRPDRLGGVRFKRIKVHTPKWHLTPLYTDPIYAANWAVDNQGKLYDWRLVFGFLVWVLPNKANRYMCNEAALEMMQFLDAHRFDPCSTQAIAETLHRFHLAATTK